MKETLLGRLVLVLCRARLKKLTAIYRYATACPLPGTDLEEPIPTSAPLSARPAGQTGDLLHHTLRREAGCWVLCFNGGHAYLKHEIGLWYVARLLARPTELLPSASLFAECSRGHQKGGSRVEMPDPETGLLTPVTDGVGTADLAVEEEEAEARQRHYCPAGAIPPQKLAATCV